MRYAWITATIALLARLVITFGYGTYLVSRAHRHACEPVQKAADAAALKVGLLKGLQVRVSNRMPSPAVWCWTRPAILLVPSDYQDGQMDWAGIAAHELAHCLRWDHLTGLLAELAVSLLPWNPLMWLSKRQLIRLGEEACDDWVIATGHSSEDYAESLLRFRPQRRMAFVPGVVHSKTGVAARVRRILNDACGNPRAGTKWVLGATTVVACVAVSFAFAQTRPAEPHGPATARQAEPAPQSENEPAAGSGNLEQPRFAARTFNSKMAFAVYYRPAPGWSQERWPCGRTPSAAPLNIPACAIWWVSAEDAVTDWDWLVREMKQNMVPGLALPWQCIDSDVKRLADLTGLRLLDLSLGQITDAGLENLKALTGLQILVLNDTQITDAGLEHLKNVPSLQGLDLTNTRITDAGLRHLKDVPSLENLTLVRTDITDAGLEHLKDSVGLRGLWLPSQIRDAGLEHLKGLTGLQTLALNGTAITDAGLEHLKGLVRLQSLNLWSTEITDAGLVHLKNLIGLQQLDLSGNPIAGAGLENLKLLTKLQRLNLANTQITDEGLEHLKNVPSLQSLSLLRTRITDAGLEHLKHLPDLQRVDLTGTQTTHAGLEHVRDMPNLRSLTLMGAGITDEGLKHLKGMPGLTSLRLVGTGITDAGLEDLKDSVGLRELWLPGQIGDSGLGHLKGLTELQMLYLDRTQITDVGLEHLKSLSKLRFLHMTNTQTTDAGLAHLKGLTGLEHLDLSATQVSDAGLEQLKQSLPTLRIVREGRPTPSRNTNKPTVRQPATPGVPQQPATPPVYDPEKMAAFKAWQDKHLAEQKQLWQHRNAALAQGRIKRGMTYTEFHQIWNPGKPILESRESYPPMGGSMMKTHAIDNTEPRSRHFVFNFFGGVLVSWTDNGQ